MIFFDLEMSRLDLSADIAWIAAIRTTPGPDFQIVERWSQKVQFREHLADQAALDTFHFDEAVWAKEAVPLTEALDDFNTFIRADGDDYQRISDRTGTKYRVVRTAAFNASFDVDRVMRACANNIPEIFWRGDPSALCVRQLAEWYFYLRPEEERPKDLKLGTLAEHFGVKFKGELHDPLVDLSVTVRLARKLVRRLHCSA